MSDMMQGGGMGHPDMQQDQGQIEDNLGRFVQELVPVLQQMASKIEYLEDRLENQLIGGLQSHYAKEERNGKIGGLRERHGAGMDELVGSLAGATGDDPEGFWEELHDLMQELAIGEEDEGPFMDNVRGHLSGKKEAMLKALQGAMGGEAAPDAIVDVQAAGEPEAVAAGIDMASKAVPAAVEKKEGAEPAVGSPEFFKNARQKGGKPSPKARK